MPELPEVETICRALSAQLTGRTITEVEVFSPAMRTSLLPLRNAHLEHQKVISVRRRGRYIVAQLSDGRGILMHFGMSGVIRIEGPDVPKRKHEHLFLHLDDGNLLRFECIRRFSRFEVCMPGDSGFPPELDQLGAEPLSHEFSGEFLFQKSRGIKCPVKAFLMNNAAVTGIGNIYATEALFESGISPMRPTEKLTRKEAVRLASEVKKVLQASILAGGTTVSDFLHVDGTEGKYAVRLAIYGKKGKPCPRCGKTIEAIQIGGRTSAYCPGCQK